VLGEERAEASIPGPPLFHDWPLLAASALSTPTASRSNLSCLHNLFLGSRFELGLAGFVFVERQFMDSLSPASARAEEARIRAAHAKRQGDNARYSWFSPGHLIMQERE